MKIAVVVLAALLVVVSAQVDQAKVKEMEALYSNPSYRQSVIKCLLDDTAPCDNHGSKLKKNLREGLSLGECPERICTPEERVVAPKILESFKKDHAADYKKITEKYGTPKPKA